MVTIWELVRDVDRSSDRTTRYTGPLIGPIGPIGLIQRSIVNCPLLGWPFW
jgi:hypothetical protein